MRRFVLAAFAVTVFSACQSATTELTDNQKGEIAAEVELLHGQFWDAWKEASVERGMEYYRNSPEFTFAINGQLLKGFDAVHDMNREFFASVTSQTVTINDLQTRVLASDIVYVIEQGVYSQTDTLGTAGPGMPFAATAVWVRQEGEWKIHFFHESEPIPETT